jgi:hypothetical protein
MKNLPPKALAAMKEGLLEEAGRIMDNAQTRVPVVTGRLRSSAFIRRRQKHKKDEIYLGYEAPYAKFVHEIPYSGKTTRGLVGAVRNGKGYKWLEKAAEFVLKGARVRLINKIREALLKAKR